MFALLNGEFVPEERALISIFDRGFVYGDGLFETIRVHRGRPFRWAHHWLRLTQGAAYLKIPVRGTGTAWEERTCDLVARNQMPEGLVRVVLTRGAGPRGYSIRGCDSPTLAVSTHPMPAPAPEAEPAGWRLLTASVRLPANSPLNRFKTCNKLPQIVARIEAEAGGADEAIVLNTDGNVAEGSSSNLFWIRRDQVITTPLESGALPGITRTAVLEICHQAGIATAQENITPAELHQAQGVFLSLSSRGIVEATWLDNHALAQSALTQQITGKYAALLQ